MGAVTNMRPDLFKAVNAQVPFVDVMNTMLDASLPLTTSEYIEWGNPNEKPAFDYMIQYSPYDNVKAQAYPAMLVEVSFNDSQVPYWEGTKLVAKLRALKTDSNPLLLEGEPRRRPRWIVGPLRPAQGNCVRVRFFPQRGAERETARSLTMLISVRPLTIAALTLLAGTGARVAAQAAPVSPELRAIEIRTRERRLDGRQSPRFTPFVGGESWIYVDSIRQLGAAQALFVRASDQSPRTGQGVVTREPNGHTMRLSIIAGDPRPDLWRGPGDDSAHAARRRIVDEVRQRPALPAPRLWDLTLDFHPPRLARGSTLDGHDRPRRGFVRQRPGARGPSRQHDCRRYDRWDGVLVSSATAPRCSTSSKCSSTIRPSTRS